MGELNRKQRIRLITIGVIALIGLTLAYSNHFENTFHFDDTHTISNNTYIRDISNIPLFFTDIATFGTMPSNRTYRPVVTTLNAIDYWLGGELKPFYFHLSIYCWYVIMIVMLFFLYKKILAGTFSLKDSAILALICAIFYGFHTSNAETINYIIMRSDSFSTLCVIASFLLYFNERARKYYLYLLTLIIGIATKESALMFIPLLFFYVLFFEQKLSIKQSLKKEHFKALIDSVLATLPAILVGVSFFFFSRWYFRPEASLFSPEESSAPLYYFMTQWTVIVHYLGNFILPLNLSADPDFEILRNLIDQKVILSLITLLTLFIIAIKTSDKHKPIAFGLLWFFIALAPTSSIKPFGQIGNDHRTFFPYIGLVLALGYYLFHLWKMYSEKIQQSELLKKGIPLVLVLIIGLHGYGIYERNKVWKTEETLWEDVAQKSPRNGRGLMNYGLTKMQTGDYQGALDLFQRAMQLMPYYSYLHINMGILTNAMGDPIKAEEYFKNAIRFDQSNVEGFYFYARFLIDQQRKNEALVLLESAQALSPGHSNSKALLNQLEAEAVQREEMIKNQSDDPSFEGLIQLSILHYKDGKYQECINACKKAIELNPKSFEAYNNMCSAYILLKQPDKAIEACNKALEINPQFELAKNNLKWAEMVKNQE